MVKTSMARAERSMLRETADRPYFFRKVIRKPKPRKIITCTSWNTEEGDYVKLVEFSLNQSISRNVRVAYVTKVSLIRSEESLYIRHFVCLYICPK